MIFYDVQFKLISIIELYFFIRFRTTYGTDILSTWTLQIVWSILQHCHFLLTSFASWTHLRHHSFCQYILNKRVSLFDFLFPFFLLFLVLFLLILVNSSFKVPKSFLAYFTLLDLFGTLLAVEYVAWACWFDRLNGKLTALRTFECLF